jgi:hypothetical protein
LTLVSTPALRTASADYLAQLRGLDRSAYIRRLVAEDAERCASELRQLSWQMSREETVREDTDSEDPREGSGALPQTPEAPDQR